MSIENHHLYEAQAAAKQRVLTKLAALKQRVDPDAYKELLSELIRAGKEQGGPEEDFWCAFEDEYCPPIDWRAEWERGALERPSESARWLRRRPTTVKELALRFPPSCIVRGTVLLHCPSPGHVAIVSIYLEPGRKHPFGALGVIAHPAGRKIYECSPESLEVVGYHKGLTRKRFAYLLARQTQ